MGPKKGKKGKKTDDWSDDDAEKKLEEKMKNLMKVDANDEDSDTPRYGKIVAQCCETFPLIFSYFDS